MLEKPFLIEIRQDRPRMHGAFIPAASLKITEEFRASGLLYELPPEELKSLVYLLTFLSPEGNCSTSLPILTSAMRISSHLVKERMHHLAEFRFRDTNLITEIQHESGLFTYSLHPHWVAYEHLTISEPHPTSPIVTGSKQRVIANTRKHYATPRAEAERMVAEQLGHDILENEDQRKLRLRLENAGLTTEQATEVLATYATDIIAQQLDWLPFRNAKNPAGYLLAAIDGGYKEPRAIRDRRFVLEEKFGGESTVNELLHNDEQELESPENELSDDVTQLEIDGPPLILPPE
mgnify:CR=1 FL=1|jgi:hypothetical protein